MYARAAASIKCDGCGEEIMPIAETNRRVTVARCPLCGEEHVYEKH